MSEPETASSKATPAEPEGNGLAARWRRRRAATKRRVGAMSRRRRIARRVGIIATWFLGLFAALMVAAVFLFYSVSDVPRPETLPLPQVATILYSDGHVMARIGTVNRTLVKLDQVPRPVRWDVLAAEDRSFYSEPGISITGTLRAAWSDLTGGDTQGGSGITQQYVKNAYLSDARTLTRKIRELAIAIKLSREYSKDQILEFYLNTVYFGRGAYGIEAASRAFFGEDVSKLDAAQGAVLAALLRAPSYYDPAVNPGEAKARWRYVLDGMVATGHLTQAAADAMPYPKVLAPKRDSGLTVGGPTELIVQRVIGELQAAGISESEIYARGMTIRTTVDERAQAAAVKAIDRTFAQLTHKQRTMKNALVAVDPSTGAVLAYYGGPNGRNYAGKPDYYDYAGLGSAAPGSSFKPYTLATALSQTMQHTSQGRPVTINSVVDGSYCVRIEATRICNDPSDRPYSTPKITVANAMKYSLNTTFDLMAAKVGPDNVAATAHAAGISKTINGRPSLQDGDGATSFGIGIGDYPVHPLDQAVGFATFANAGVANQAFFVQDATDSNGHVVYRHDAHPNPALDPKVANDVTLTLEPIAAWSGVPLAGERVSAAKTGTEGIQRGRFAGQNSDAWMVGYTPQVSTAVWVGSGNATKPIYSATGGQEYGRDMPGRTWRRFMNIYLRHKPKLPMATRQQVFAHPGGSTVVSTTSASVSTAPTSTSAAPSTSAATTSSAAPSTTATSSSPTESATPTRTTHSPPPPSSSASTGCAPNCTTSPPPRTSSPPQTSAAATSSSRSPG